MVGSHLDDDKGVEAGAAWAYQLGITEACLLDLTLGYADGTLTMNFELGTPEPATWGVWMLIPNIGVLPIWSVGIQPIDPSRSFSVPLLGFPSMGTMGVLTALITSEGITCSDWDTVNTGGPSSITLSQRELRELFQNSGQILPGQ